MVHTYICYIYGFILFFLKCYSIQPPRSFFRDFYSYLIQFNFDDFIVSCLIGFLEKDSKLFLKFNAALSLEGARDC